MARITRAELKRRRRIEFYKKCILSGFLIMTILPIVTSCILLGKVNRLEKQVDLAMNQSGSGYLAKHSSKEALKDNPNAATGFFADVTRTAFGDSKTDIKQAISTENPESVMAPDSMIQDADSTEVIASTEQLLAEVSSGTHREAKGRVYLTFDDGPSIYTGQILDILKENNVKATFFVIGQSEEYYPYYQRIVQEGHSIGMHSYTHVYQDLYESVDSFANEVTELDQLIFDVTGVHSKLFRFPGGSSNSVAPLPMQDYIAYLNEHNINYYDWNALNGDAVTLGLSPQTLVDNIMNDVTKNEDSIVLMHDLQTTHTTVESLQLLLDTLQVQGYEVLPIDENTPLIQHVSCNDVEE